MIVYSTNDVFDLWHGKVSLASWRVPVDDAQNGRRALTERGSRTIGTVRMARDRRTSAASFATFNRGAQRRVRICPTRWSRRFATGYPVASSSSRQSHHALTMRVISRLAAFASATLPIFIHPSRGYFAFGGVRMLPRDLCTGVEHQARVLFALRIEACEVAEVSERRGVPLDARPDTLVGGQDDFANLKVGILHGILVLREPGVHFFAAGHQACPPTVAGSDELESGKTASKEGTEEDAKRESPQLRKRLRL